jgi:Do/DeqQ family serine protease
MGNKGFLSMLISSILGGIIAILLFVSFGKSNGNQYASDTSAVNFTNYVFDSADFVVPEGLNFVFAAKSATPSVVHIRTIYRGGRTAQTPFNDFFKEYFGDRYQDYQNPSRGAGSGVIMSADGYIVTNNHVIEGASEIEVVLNDNRSYKADVIGTDPATDIAVIQIKENNLKAISLGNSDGIQIGEWVLAIGNPFEFRSTVTAGIVSAKARNINIIAGRDRLESFIQTDAAVNPGNSGGALVNLKGELVGINTAIASPTGAFAGYSFAIPVSLVQKVVADLTEFGMVQRALLGISIRDVTADLAKEYNLSVIQGVYVIEVNFNSAAAEGGLKAGDVIVAIQDRSVKTVAELQEQVALNRPGNRIKVTYIRDGKTYETMTTLKNASGTTNVVEVSNSFRTEGAIFENLSSATKSELNLDGGVQISEIETGTWKTAGLKKGFIITKVDKKPIADLEDFIAVVNSAKGNGLLIEGYYPNGDKAYYGIGW